MDPTVLNATADVIAKAPDHGDNMHSVEEKPGSILTQTWSNEAERKVVRKLDCILMPLLACGFFALQLDRSNISNALTSTITKDLGITRAQVNGGNQLQLAGVIVAEIPANLLLQKVGSAKWLVIQCFCWGMVGTFQAFINNRGSFYATRFLLGVFEAGYIPGSMLVMSLFYKRSEIALRTAIFYFGNYFSAGTGSLIAAGVLQLSGKHGLSGWQWLFLIDGSATLFMCIVFILLLPSSPLHTLPLCKIKRFDFFTEQERELMHDRVILDDPTKSSDFHKLTFKSVIRTLLHFNLWTHFAINVLGLSPKGGLQLYSPLIIKELGFSRLSANALASVSNYGVCILSFVCSYISDRMGVRGPWCILACAFPMIFSGVQFGLPLGADKWTKYAIFTMLNSANGISQTLNDAWLSSNADTHLQRSIGLALCVIGSNLGGLAGQQLFQEDDAPRYTHAFVAILCLYTGAMAMVIIQIGIYIFKNRSIARSKEQAENINAPSRDNQRKYEL